MAFTRKPILGMNETRDPDYDLVKQIQLRRDDKLFATLLRKYENKVYNFCVRFLGNDFDASDCTQEIFIRVFENLSHFRFKATFSTWLYRIMVNCCKDMIRSGKNIKMSYYKSDHPDADIIQYADKSDSPERLLYRKEINEAFQIALGKLKEVNRIVLILRDIEGRSYNEIAELTGLKQGTVRSSLSRARCRMADELKTFQNGL